MAWELPGACWLLVCGSEFKMAFFFPRHFVFILLLLFLKKDIYLRSREREGVRAQAGRGGGRGRSKPTAEVTARAKADAPPTGCILIGHKPPVSLLSLGSQGFLSSHRLVKKRPVTSRTAQGGPSQRPSLKPGFGGDQILWGRAQEAGTGKWGNRPRRLPRGEPGRRPRGAAEDDAEHVSVSRVAGEGAGRYPPPHPALAEADSRPWSARRSRRGGAGLTSLAAVFARSCACAEATSMASSRLQARCCGPFGGPTPSIRTMRR